MAPPKKKIVSEVEKEAGLVMDTNSSSIVSKRSVEKIYLPEPHFFRYFVKKFQRRSPLINFGYWIRMRAVEYAVRQFLEEPMELQKVVVNLGAGYDPLPFQCLSQFKEHCEGVKFVDIDHDKLMAKKRDVICATQQLKDVLGEIETSCGHDSVLMKAQQYLAIGCDLKELEKLTEALNSQLDTSKCAIMWVSEVAITYMAPDDSDAVIKWASSQSPKSRFCLLEQMLPDGRSHPFASTMFAHFEKLRAPIKSIYKYQTVEQQLQRFESLGWKPPRIQTLWELWHDREFVTLKEKEEFIAVEPFDEWEEFALFASHYILIVADNVEVLQRQLKQPDPAESQQTFNFTHEKAIAKGASERRFAAAYSNIGNTFAIHGGHGRQARLNSTDVYANDAVCSSVASQRAVPFTLTSRMCHTITNIDNDRTVLIGGRTSPTNALQDCWLYQNSTGRWTRLEDLPEPRYRHSTLPVKIIDRTIQTSMIGIMVCGGKNSNGKILGDWLLWTPDRVGDNTKGQWHVLKQKIVNKEEALTASFTPRFGATVVLSEPPQKSHSVTQGFLFGGLDKNGEILQDYWLWTVIMSREGKWHVSFRDWTSTKPDNIGWLARLGASTTMIKHGFVVAGGITKFGCIPHEWELGITKYFSRKSVDFLPVKLDLEDGAQRPLLIGHCAWAPADGKGTNVHFVGGGAVCFSFGSFCNDGVWKLEKVDLIEKDSQDADEADETDEDDIYDEIDGSDPKFSPTGYRYALSLSEAPSLPSRTSKPVSAPSEVSQPVAIPSLTHISTVDFAAIVKASQPVILKGLDIGSCTTLWTKEYLIEKIGQDRKVVVHESKTANMNFATKNFAYTTKDFGTFMNEIHSDAEDEQSRQYLRSISSDKPTEVATTLEEDFPEIASDLEIPDVLQVAKENVHSSPMRISGNVNMWLHYDVMANIYVQIRGSKRLVLYPPSDVGYLNFAPGSSSSPLNVFPSAEDNKATQAPKDPIMIPNTHPHIADLEPGDILFLPPLWLHTGTPLTATSVAVNVFFRNLKLDSANGTSSKKGVYAAGRDVYANRDIQAYEQGRRDMAKIAKAFEGLGRDSEIRRFYLERLVGELRDSI